MANPSLQKGHFDASSGSQEPPLFQGSGSLATLHRRTSVEERARKESKELQESGVEEEQSLLPHHLAMDCGRSGSPGQTVDIHITFDKVSVWSKKKPTFENFRCIHEYHTPPYLIILTQGIYRDRDKVPPSVAH